MPYMYVQQSIELLSGTGNRSNRQEGVGGSSRSGGMVSPAVMEEGRYLRGIGTNRVLHWVSAALSWVPS